MKSKRLFFISILVVILLMSTTFGFTQEDVNLVFGSGSTPTSSYFPFHATTNQMVDAAPGVRSTMTIVNGSVGGAMAILRGENIDIAGGLGLAIIYQMTHGLGPWEGNPLPNDLRVLFTYLTSNCPLVVRADSGIEQISDFDGKVYGMGYQGSSSQTLLDAAFKALGYDVKTDSGSFEDAVEDMKNNRLIGYAKATPSNHLDAAFQDIMLSKKLKIIGWSEDEIAQIRKVAPYVSFSEIPEDNYVGVKHPRLWDLTVPMAWVCHKDMSEEVAYKITKSYTELWEEKLKNVFPNMANDNPVITPTFASQVEGVYVHPGALRYYKEIGVEIPESVIPPEMK